MLQPTTIPGPGFYGLAKQKSQVALGPEWATVAENCVIDGAGRLGCRKGWVRTNATAITGEPDVVQVHEYVKSNGDVEFITATAGGLWSGSSTVTSKVGTLTPTAGNWKFVNFNGKVLGWQASHTPIVYNGTGDFAEISAVSGTLPDGNTALAAFGRVWAVDDDKQTIRYCALLDETRWATADGGGVIDMRSVWTRGTDEVVGIIAYGSSLVVFGKRHIVIWTDGSGSELGLSPTSIYVGMVIENVGLVTRDAVALVGETDVVFWSSNGVRSLRRTLQEQATPVNEIAGANRDFLADYLSVGSLSAVRCVYSPKDGFVLLIHPSITFCFDMRQPLPDGGFRMTTWTLAPKAACATISEEIFFGFEDGVLGKYAGYTDNGAAYQWKYESGWMLLAPAEQLKMLKRLKAFVFSPADRTITFKWWTDWKSNVKIALVDVEGEGDEWNVDEWSLMEWSGGVAFHEIFVPLSHTGQYVKIGMQASIKGRPIAVHHLTLYTKPGRIA